jgi:predicted dehydrogenase
MGFNAHTVCGEEDRTTIIGTRRVLRARGSGLNAQNRIEWFTPEGTAIIPLEGEWFKSGLQGTMGELLSAIEQKREPYHSAANNLASLELCFAAMASAESNLPVKPGSVSRIEKA